MNQIDNIMALADEYAHAHAKFWLESLYGTSKPYTADCKEERDEQQQALRAAIEQSLKDVALSAKHGTPGEPVAWGIIASNTGRIAQVELDAEEVADHNSAHIVPLYASPQPLYTAPQPQPKQEPREHITDGSPCWCNPDVIEEENGNVIVHNYDDNWQQYAKPGETAQHCIERHRSEQDALMELLKQASQPQPKQEPVAWMYEWDGRTHLTFTDQRFVEQAHPHFNKATPLYTAPQPIDQPKQEPVAFICQGNAYMADDVDEFCQAKHTPLYTAPALSKPLGEQEILDLLPKVQAGWTATTYGIWVARAIERAHGISGSTNNQKPKLHRTVTYVCPVCAASLERQE